VTTEEKIEPQPCALYHSPKRREEEDQSTIFTWNFKSTKVIFGQSEKCLDKFLFALPIYFCRNDYASLPLRHRTCVNKNAVQFCPSNHKYSDNSRNDNTKITPRIYNKIFSIFDLIIISRHLIGWWNVMSGNTQVTLVQCKIVLKKINK